LVYRLGVFKPFDLARKENGPEMRTSLKDLQQRELEIRKRLNELKLRDEELMAPHLKPLDQSTIEEQEYTPEHQQVVKERLELEAEQERIRDEIQRRGGDLLPM